MSEHTFRMTLEPNGSSSRVLLDDVDISGQLCGVSVDSGVQKATRVVLHTAHGRRAEIEARVPGAQVYISPDVSDAIEALSSWLRHDPSCEADPTHECTCGLRAAMQKYRIVDATKLGDAMREYAKNEVG